MQLEIRRLHQVLPIVVVFAAGGGEKYVRACQIDIRIHVVIGEIAQIVHVVRHAFVCDTQAHLKPAAGMQVKADTGLPVGRDFTLTAA